MKRNCFLKQSIDSIKRTEELISLHKTNNDFDAIIDQYEAIKAKQIAELIDSLSLPPYQNLEGILMIEKILDKFYPDMPAGSVSLNGLKELADAINSESEIRSH